MKKLDKEAEMLSKMLWNRYLEQYGKPPSGFPRDPEEEYGDKFQGWVMFLLEVTDYLEKEKES